MSDSKSVDSIDVKCIKENAVLTIEVPTELYYRVHNLLMAGIPFADIESMHKVLATIKNSTEDPDSQTYHTRTLIWLIANMEKAAEDQNLVEVKKVDKNSGTLI